MAALPRLASGATDYERRRLGRAVGLGNVGYDGPLGTVGRAFRFRFGLFALDEPLDVPPKLNKQELVKAVSRHVLDEAELLCTHERPPAE